MVMDSACVGDMMTLFGQMSMKINMTMMAVQHDQTGSGKLGSEESKNMLKGTCDLQLFDMSQIR